VDAITGRTNDLGHVSPHRVKPLADKGSSIACSGDWYFTGVGLIPGSVYDVCVPVIVSQSPVLWIDHTGEYSFGALLHTAETAHTGIKIFRFIHGTHVMIVILEYVIDTLFFDTFPATTGTVFSELYCGIFADRIKTR